MYNTFYTHAVYKTYPTNSIFSFFIENLTSKLQVNTNLLRIISPIRKKNSIVPLNKSVRFFNIIGFSPPVNTPYSFSMPKSTVTISQTLQSIQTHILQSVHKNSVETGTSTKILTYLTYIKKKILKGKRKACVKKTMQKYIFIQSNLLKIKKIILLVWINFKDFFFFF